MTGEVVLIPLLIVFESYILLDLTNLVTKRFAGLKPHTSRLVITLFLHRVPKLPTPLHINYIY